LLKGNIPLPVLLKIKKGIFYIPSLYTITDGVSVGLKDAFPSLDAFNDQKVYKVILKRNNMSDYCLSNILKGIIFRPEVFSFSSELNEIGSESA
jgi:hypothetical protein